jgi:type II secretory pathway pseudopilin PulG
MKKKAGMTFLEVMIALFLFTLMISAVFGVFLAARRMDLSSRYFTEARQKAQTRLEWLYQQSQSLSYADTLFQLIQTQQYTCTGFSWSTDPLTLEITYNPPSDVVACSVDDAGYTLNLTFTKNTVILSKDIVDILVRVTHVQEGDTITRYETVYTASFLP